MRAVIPRPGASVAEGLEIPSYEHVREAYEKVSRGVVRSVHALEDAERADGDGDLLETRVGTSDGVV